MPKSTSTYATLLLFYGLYFGVLGRDFAELCSWRMNQAMGYSKKDDDEPAHSIGWHDNQPEVQPATLQSNDEDEACDACAI